MQVVWRLKRVARKECVGTIAWPSHLWIVMVSHALVNMGVQVALDLAAEELRSALERR